ncbi:MAG TPA: hypothetical protein VML50_17535 [Anaeromyxobacter sp.]|nr:hypothetical protein [Anaeromyxobacter sp.]
MLVLVAALAAAPAAAVNDALCIPSTDWRGWIGSPNVTSFDPLDKGWADSTRYTFDNGTTDPHGALQVIRDASYVYISMEAHHLPSVDNGSVVALTMQFPAGGNDHRRFIVYPEPPNATNATGDFFPAIKYYSYQGSGDPGAPNGPGWGSDQGGTIGSWATVLAHVQQEGSSYGWFVILRLAIGGSGLPFPTTGDFGMYVDVVAPNGPCVGYPTCSPVLAWPQAAGGVSGPIEGPTQGSLTPTTYPAPSTWGLANFGAGTACTGIDIQPGNLYVNSAGNTLITHGANTFMADVTNSGGAAGPVRWRFQRAGFGMSWDWTPIPGDNADGWRNSTTINGGTSTLSSLPWTPDPSLWNTHGCIQLDMDDDPANPANVHFLHRSAIANFDVSKNSLFTDAPAINTRGVPGGGLQHFVLRPSARASIALADKSLGDLPPGSIVEQFVFMVHGYRNLGRSVIVNGREIGLTEAISFGYALQHPLGKVLSLDKLGAARLVGPSAGVVASASKAGAVTSPQQPTMLTHAAPAGAARAAAVPYTTPWLPGVPSFGIELDPAQVGVAAASLGHYQFSLGGAGGAKDGAYQIDLPANQVQTLATSVEYIGITPNCQGCPKAGGSSLALVAFGLLLMRRTHRRRK